MERMREITSYIHERVSVTVCLKTDGTTTGQDGPFVALMMRRGKRRDSLTMTTGQVTCSPTQINESTRPWTWQT